jgi:hypothetical protein
MNALLIATSNPFATRQQIQEYLNTVPEITYWYACLPQCIFCTSSLTAAELAKRLETHFGHAKGRRFLVVRVTKDCQGRLPTQAWQMFADPDNPRQQ